MQSYPFSIPHSHLPRMQVPWSFRILHLMLHL